MKGDLFMKLTLWLQLSHSGSHRAPFQISVYQHWRVPNGLGAIGCPRFYSTTRSVAVGLGQFSPRLRILALEPKKNLSSGLSLCSAMSCWASDFTSLHLCFLTCDMVTASPPSQGFFRIRWDEAWWLVLSEHSINSSSSSCRKWYSVKKGWLWGLAMILWRHRPHPRMKLPNISFYYRNEERGDRKKHWHLCPAFQIFNSYNSPLTSISNCNLRPEPSALVL